MHYIIYQITNKINGKIYIGKHVTNDVNDSYMGSGKLVKAAINKYGLENFQKEILFLFETEEQMNAKEAEIVTEEFCLREDTYNLCVGGQGGFSYINRLGINVDLTEQRKRNPSIVKKAAVNGGKRKKWLMKHDQSHRHQSLEKTRQGLKAYYKSNNGNFSSKTHSQETKEKMSLAKKGKNTGKKNSQHGTMWITNGVENKKIKKVDSIPEGWYKGRKVKQKSEQNSGK